MSAGRSTRNRGRLLTAKGIVTAAIVGLSAMGALTAQDATANAHAARHAKAHHTLRHHAKACHRLDASHTATGAALPATPLAPAVATARGACADRDLIPSPANLDRVRAAVLCLVNQERAGRGLAPLREDAALQTAAEDHATGMVSDNYFDHVSPTGLGLLDTVLGAGYSAERAILGLGENIAYGLDGMATPAFAVADWMAQPDHRSTILTPAFTDTGIGVVPSLPALIGPGPGATYAEDFGTRQ